MPRLDGWFRTFHYASLGFACACLMSAEFFFLGPLTVVMSLASLLAMGLAAIFIPLALGFHASRWMLPAWAANLLGLGVVAANVGLIAWQLTADDTVLATLPLPAGLLPYLGPTLVGLLLVKLFRQRTPRDFWLLHGIAAAQVALACVLASNPASDLFFASLFAGYVFSALCCLALHHLQDEQRQGTAAALSGPAIRLPFRWYMIPFAVRWSLAVAGVAVPLFLLMPRPDGPTWDSSELASQQMMRGAAPRATSGFSQTIDLNGAGAIQLSNAEAFTVRVEAGTPPAGWPDDPHWRGGVLDDYHAGRWLNRDWMQRPDLPRPPSPSRLGSPGLDQYVLAFDVRPNAGGLVLAEPVRTGGDPARATAVEAAIGPDAVVFFPSSRGPVLPSIYEGSREYHYRQIAARPRPTEHAYADDVDLFYLDQLTAENLPGLAEWTAQLLDRLARDPRYEAYGLDAVAPGRPPPEQWEAEAQALTAYLSDSGEFTYSLELRRQDASLDPVLDFLFHVKEGPCERYASALALMLRSRGIPARVVVGYRGAERLSDGSYLVRQKQAHAWVEALKPFGGAAPGGAAGLGVKKIHLGYEWLSLDPTPPGEASPAPFSLWNWWQSGKRTGQELWGGLVVNYNARQQADLRAGLFSDRSLALLAAVVAGTALLLGCGGLTLAGVWLQRRRRTRSSRKPAGTAGALYARLLALLARHGGPRPRPGQTPREFAAESRRFLEAAAGAAALAGVPDEVVTLLYRARFGGRPLSVEEQNVLGARLDALAAALRGR